MGLFNSGVNRGIRTLMEQSKDAGVGEQAIHNFMGRNGLKTVGGALSDAGGIDDFNLVKSSLTFATFSLSCSILLAYFAPCHKKLAP